MPTPPHYATGQPWLDTLLSGLLDNRTLLQSLLAQHLPTVTYQPGAASYLAWLDCSALGYNQDNNPTHPRGQLDPAAGPAAWFLHNARVAVNAGAPFGTGGSAHVRLNFGTTPEILTEAVTRLRTAVDQSNGAAAAIA